MFEQKNEKIPDLYLSVHNFFTNLIYVNFSGK